ncbi:MAG: hypothetical protein R3Y63_07320 [Eubacteriales bacterium]
MNYVAIIRTIQSNKEILGLISNDHLKLTHELAKAKRYQSEESAQEDIESVKTRYGNDIQVRVTLATSELCRNPEIHKFTSRINMIIQHYEQNTIMIGPYEQDEKVMHFLINNHTEVTVEADFKTGIGKMTGTINHRGIDGYGTNCAEYHDFRKLLSDLNDALLGRILL